MNEITKMLRKGKNYNLRAKCARYWDIVQTRNIKKSVTENLAFVPYEGLNYSVDQPLPGTYGLTIYSGQLPDYSAFTLKTFMLAPAGGNYFHVPYIPDPSWADAGTAQRSNVQSGSSVSSSSYISHGVLDGSDTAEEKEYNLFINSAHDVLLSEDESMEGRLWCGTVVVPAHTQNVQYKINFEASGLSTHWKMHMYFTPGAYLKAVRGTENITTPLVGPRYRILMRVYTESVENERHFATTPLGSIGYFRGRWQLRRGLMGYADAPIATDTWYWVQVINDGAEIRLYYLEDQFAQFTAETLPALSSWSLGVNKSDFDIMGAGDFYLSDPVAGYGLDGQIDLSSVSVRNITLNEDGTQSEEVVWEPFIKVNLLNG